MTKQVYKLLLASGGSFVIDGQYKLFEKPRSQVKWAYVTTAGKSVPDDSYLQKHRNRMRELNWDFEEIDIADKNADELRKMLRSKDAIFIEGGNTFYLLKCIKKSGFTEVIQELLDQGVVYVGSSAGSYVACPTIEMATWKEHKKFNRHGVTDFTAMNLVPFIVVAHYTPDLESRLKPKISAVRYPVKLITDRQAILVEGNKINLIEDNSLVFDQKL